ncbi:hypothetical protein [Streptomyces fulvorobeus]|uniref:Putative small secreted protein n=1 Tax=Streptomyces fulvorobeus TaxID=284028 RepID=A0A7J0CGL2_9ACTN|nr:hypothetical protein [Streptomyces fulvorobeus]NYE44864.1 putative small secreted protein [Streptomyces fulvorobeus]GFN01418.1 hypothetical protein Sfulv_62280 [Streptomyces fulvorobeus]
MTARYRMSAAVLLAVALAAGCTTTTTSGQDKQPAASAAAADRARAYMRAVLASDWTTACSLMATARRGDCHDRHPTPQPPDPAGPDIGPVLLDRPPTRVPATSAHPAGWGVMVTHTVTWPGKPARASFTALRMTDAAGAWWVEQREDVADSDLTHAADPILSALSREIR